MPSSSPTVSDPLNFWAFVCFEKKDLSYGFYG